MNALKCIEIEPEMLDDLHNGKLEIRGNLDDETILVSSSKSYKIRQADSSNTILLASTDNADGGGNESIFSAISCVYELTLQPPKLNALHNVLYQRAYHHINQEEEEKEKKKLDLSMDGLRLLVQCSDGELIDALTQIDAIQIGKEWRVLHAECLCACLEEILFCIIEKQIDFKQFKLADIVVPDLYPQQIIHHCVKIHCSDRRADDAGNWSLDTSKVCVFWAKRLLKQNGDKMKETEFMRKWNEGLPYGMEPNMAMLSGHCIALQDFLTIFEESKLSLDAKQRFKALFERKSEWTMDQIVPYLRGLMHESGQTAEKLLLRHARMVRIKGPNGQKQRIYISRSAKQNK